MIFHHYPLRPEIQQQLKNNTPLLVVCFCAAWCNTCTEYQQKFAEVTQQFPEHLFVWLDIEEHEDLLDEFDIENFPTLLIQNPKHTFFFGTMLPHVQHLTKFLSSMSTTTHSSDNAPAAYEYLLA